MCEVSGSASGTFDWSSFDMAVANAEETFG